MKGEHDLNNEINDLSGQKFDEGHLGESNLIAEGKQTESSHNG